VLILIMIPVAYSFIGGQMPEEHEEEAVEGVATGEGDDGWLPDYLQEEKSGKSGTGADFARSEFRSRP